MPSCLGSCRERQRSCHLLNDRVIRGPRGTGCGRGQTHESLNEVRIHVTHLNALSDRFLECVIPKDGLSLIVLDGRSGRSFLHRGQMSFCLSKVCQKMVCQFLVHEIPKDGLSLIVLDDPMDALSGRSFLLRGQMSFALRKVCQMMVDQFLVREIPMDGQSGMLACDLNRAILNCGRYKKVYLTSSFFPGGRRLVLRCVAYLTTRALERGRQILERRRNFWCRALRGHLLCDEACDRLQFLEPLAPSCCRGQAYDHSSREGRQRPCGGSF